MLHQVLDNAVKFNASEQPLVMLSAGLKRPDARSRVAGCLGIPGREVRGKDGIARVDAAIDTLVAQGRLTESEEGELRFVRA